MEITLTKKSYNFFKCWGAVNLVLGFLALYVGFTNDAFLSLILATIGIVSGVIMITFIKGKFVETQLIQVPVKPLDNE